MDKSINQKIAIIGDGITAKLALIALNHLNLPCEIIAPRKKKLNSCASLSISNHNYNFLKKIGVVDLDKIANPIFSIKLYEKDFNEAPDTIFYHKIEEAPLNYVLLKDDLEKLLDKLIIKLKIPSIKSPKKIYSLSIKTFTDKSEFLKWDYKEKAYTFIIQHNKTINNCSRQFFTENGPIAFLPLSSTLTSVVWSVNIHSDINQLINSKLKLEKFLNEKFNFLSKIKVKLPVEDFHLSFNFLTSTINIREIFLGDCTHKIHPIAGQGWNMSIRDIEQLYKIYKTKQYYGYDLGEYSILEEYEKKTKINNLLFATSMDIIRKIFKIKNNSISNLRKNIFQKLDQYPEIKKEIIKIADQGLSLRI